MSEPSPRATPTPTPTPPPTVVTAVAVPGMGEVRAGDDLAASIAGACVAAGVALRDEDVVVVASKVVAKAEGRSVPAPDAAARQRAIEGQSVRVVAERQMADGRRTQVVQSRSGPVMAAAGVDASDVDEGTVLLLPADPDASARALRGRLAELLGARPAVLVTDTGGRPWREGVADFALGAAGVAVLDDRRGTLDSHGRRLDVTVRGIADEVAALADLVKGKAAGTPVAVVSGMGAHVVPGDGPGAGLLVRTGPGDWFAHGHVEAVAAALGLPPGGAGAPPPPPIDPRRSLAERLARAVAVARAGRGIDADVTVRSAGDAGGRGGDTAETDGTGGGDAGEDRSGSAVSVVLDGDPLGVAVAIERLHAAAWAEGLTLARAGDPTRGRGRDGVHLVARAT